MHKKKTLVKRPPTPKPCKCIENINKELGKTGSNTRLDSTEVINFATGKIRSTARIAVVKDNPKSREPLKGIIPSFCPFCGKKYPK